MSTMMIRFPYTLIVSRRNKSVGLFINPNSRTLFHESGTRIQDIGLKNKSGILRTLHYDISCLHNSCTALTCLIFFGN